MRRTTAFALVSTAALALGGCGDSSVLSSSSASSAHAWVLTSEPDGAISVAEAKSQAGEGDVIVVRGRIGGRAEPITEGSPVFTLVDLALPHCGQLEGDGCPTPWDYCCEPQENLRANSATVQLVGASDDGSTVDPKAGGLEPLDEVVVVGTIGPRPSDDVLTIRASGVYRP